MMRVRFLLLWYLLEDFSLAYSRLIRRHAEDPGEAVLNNLGNTVLWGAEKGVDFVYPFIENTGNAINNFLTPQPGETVTTENKKAPSDYSNSPLVEPKRSDPDSPYRLQIDCDAQPPGPCRVTFKYIIWAKPCSPQYEATIVSFLKQNVVGKPIDTSRDMACKAVDFWATELTEDQAKEARRLKGVVAVERNQPVKIDYAFGQPVKIKQHQKGVPLQKRDVVMQRQDSEDLALNFISTGNYADANEKHTYFARNGLGITLYLPDTGIDFAHEEFRHHSGTARMLFSFSVSRTPNDDIGHGTCMASLACGQFRSTAGDVRIVAIKSFLDEASVLNAMLLILNDLQNRFSQGEQLEGQNVVFTSLGWADKGRESDRRFRSRILRMLNVYQATVVAPAGDIISETDLTQFLPAGLAPGNPVIAVGGVDVTSGMKFAWSPPGDFVTVLAPGKVFCAAVNTQDSYLLREGSTEAAALTAGVAAYLQSLEDLGPIFRASAGEVGGVPAAVRDWMLDKAWARRGTSSENKAIWGGIRVSRGVAQWDYRTGLGTIGGWTPDLNRKA